MLFQHVLLVPQLLEPLVLQGLGRRDSVVGVVNQQFLNQVDDFRASMRNQLGDARSLHSRKVELHVGCVFLEVVQQLLLRRAHNVVNFVHLVNFVVAWKQRKQRNDFEKDTANAPQVHFVAVIAVGEEAFGRTVPPGGDVLCVRLLGVDSPAGSEVSKLDMVLREQDVFWFDVAVEDAVSMHVVDALDQLVHVILHPVLRQVVPLALDGVVHVHVHEFENQCESTGGFIAE